MALQAAGTDATRSCFFIGKDSNHFIFQKSGQPVAPHAWPTLDEFSSRHDYENVVLNKASRFLSLFSMDL
jgi:hypothetical protein